MSESLCPSSPDGRHKRKVWQDNFRGTSGLACVLCHKSWYHTLNGEVPTWDHLGLSDDKIPVSGSGSREGEENMQESGEGDTHPERSGSSVSGSDGPDASLSVTGRNDPQVAVQPDADELGSGAVDSGPGDGSETESRSS